MGISFDDAQKLNLAAVSSPDKHKLRPIQVLQEPTLLEQLTLDQINETFTEMNFEKVDGTDLTLGWNRKGKQDATIILCTSDSPGKIIFVAAGSESSYYIEVILDDVTKIPGQTRDRIELYKKIFSATCSSKVEALMSES